MKNPSVKRETIGLQTINTAKNRKIIPVKINIRIIPLIFFSKGFKKLGIILLLILKRNLILLYPKTLKK